MNKYFKICLLLIITVFLITGCDLFSTKFSASERLQAFEDELNSATRSATDDHIHPDATDYQSINDSFWTYGPLGASNSPFSFSGVTLSSEVNGIITGTGSMTNSSGPQTVNSITFKEYPSGSDDWYILSITINNSIVLQ